MDAVMTKHAPSPPAPIEIDDLELNLSCSGDGALPDADLSREAAGLQALQAAQQLDASSLALTSEAPQSLLSLFR